MPQFIFLWTDIAIWTLFLGAVCYGLYARKNANLRSTWRRVLTDAPAMCSAVVLMMFVAVALLDSIHYRPVLPPAEGASPHAAPIYAPIVRSALEGLVDGTNLKKAERRFSAPLATRQFVKETVLTPSGPVREFRPLQYGGLGLPNPDAPRAWDIGARAAKGLAVGAGLALILWVAATALVARRRDSWGDAWLDIVKNDTSVPVRAILITATLLFAVMGVVGGISSGYHVLGTDQTGNDVLWQCLRSIRTALVIGSLTTIAMLPPAIVLGISAGYFKGRVDDIIQYVYTTLTSIPSVLLVAACVLLLQAFIDNNPDLFPTSAQRADLRLFMLCMILGLTGWSALCRLLRAEALKLRELEYIQAAKAFGVSHWTIMLRHILPNVMHIVLITIVLEFSGLVLYEAVLSYLGIGVDPSTASFGSMIDASRLDMARDPMVWWSLFSAFLFMLTLVLSANLFADAVRAAFDPRSRAFRLPRRRRTPPSGPLVNAPVSTSSSPSGVAR